MKRLTRPEQMEEAYLGDYPRLDPDFYEEFESFLRRKGFRKTGDVCIKTPGLNKAIARNTVYRCMCDATGTVMAACYQVGFTRLRRILPRLLGIRCDKVIEFRAATLSGGVFLAANLEAPAFQIKTLKAAGVRLQQSPCNTPVAAMYANWVKLIADVARTERGDETLFRLDAIGLQKNMMEYEEEKGMRYMQTKKPLTPEEFSTCANIHMEPSELILRRLDELQKQKE